MAFSIPTYELHVRPNHEHGSSPGSNGNAIWVFHTSPTVPIGLWGSIPNRRTDTAVSYEYWLAFEFKVDASWNTSLQGGFGTIIPNCHTLGSDELTYPGSLVSPFYLSYRNDNLYSQAEPNSPNHSVIAKSGVTKGVWHSVLLRLIFGRTDGTVPAGGHPNGGAGRVRLWYDGSDTPFDTGNINNLYRTAGGQVQSKTSVAEGFYSSPVAQDCIFSMTAGRWGKTVSECLADSQITFQGDQVSNVYTGSGLNLGPSSYSTLSSRQDTNFLVPPQFGGVPAPPPPGPGGAQTGPYAAPIQWNSVVDPVPDPPPTVPETEGPWGDPIQWNSQAAPVGIGGTSATGRFFKRFYGPGQLLSAPGDLYTVPSGKRAVIRHIHVSNPGVPANPEIQSVNFTFSIGTDAAATRLWDGYPISSDDLLQHFRDHALVAGEKIQAYASMNNVLNLTVEGYEESLEAQVSTDVYGEGAYGDETYGT